MSETVAFDPAASVQPIPTELHTSGDPRFVSRLTEETRAPVTAGGDIYKMNYGRMLVHRHLS